IFQFARGMKFLGETIEHHPTATKYVLEFIAGLAGFLVVAGSIAIGIAAITALGGSALAGGAIGATIIAIAGALTYLLRLVDWHAFGSWATGLIKGAQEFAAVSGKWVG